MLVALKAIKKSYINENKMKNQIKNEIKIQSFLNHPNILKLYGFFESNDKIYLILEFANEGELYRVLKKQVIIIKKKK